MQGFCIEKFRINICAAKSLCDGGGMEIIMSRSAWKWILGIHLTLLILFVMFDICIWALANVSAIVQVEMYPDVFTYRKLTFWEFFADFHTSPSFYVHLYLIVVVIASIVALILTRKKKR